MFSKNQIFPDKVRVLSGSMLKLIAVTAMLIDHIASHLIPHSLPVYTVMRCIGRLAFPIFVFLLIEGFLHTRNRLRYGASLLIFALISEIPWNLVHGGEWHYRGQNVFFTLFLGFLGMYAMDFFKKRPIVQVAAICALCLTATLIKCDYGSSGVVFIILFFALRENEVARPFISFILSRPWFVLASFIPISLYNGKRGFIKGKVLKYIFYSFYPVHLLILYFIKYRIFF